MKCRWILCFAVFTLIVCNAFISSAQVSTGVSFYQQALQEMKAGNFNEALVRMQSALMESPGQLEYQYELGVIYFDLGRLDESEGIFQALVHKDEARFGKVWFDLAHIARKRGKRLEAHRISPEGPACRSWKGRSGDWDSRTLNSKIIKEQLIRSGKCSPRGRN